MKKMFLFVALTLATGSASVRAQNPVIPGYEVLRQTDTTTEREQGEFLLAELNCLSCHAPSEANKKAISAKITTKAVPELSAIGKRVSPNWLQEYITDPHQHKPGATMPDMLSGLTKGNRAKTAELISHFLLERSGSLQEPEYQAFDFRRSVNQGRALFETLGCVACHSSQEQAFKAKITSVPLPDLAEKTSVKALTQFLIAPDRFRHDARMPSFHLSNIEAKSLAIYLLRTQKTDLVRKKSGIEYAYYEGTYSRRMPDFDSLTPKHFGYTDKISLKLPIKRRNENFAIRFSGMLTIKNTARYTFTINSDDGSKLLIDGDVVVDNDGDHGNVTVKADIELSAGEHQVEIQYYQGGAGSFLGAKVSGGDIDGTMPLDSLTSYETVVLKPRGLTAFKVDKQKASKGGELFVSSGCSACHSNIPVTEKQSQTPHLAKPLNELNLNSASGCLSNQVASPVPQFHLAEHQKSALRATLSDLDTLATARTPQKQLVNTLATYNCYACHQRKENESMIGGPGESRSGYFKVIDDMDFGDEGRIPPTLTQVGGKLTIEAMKSVLTDQKHHVRRHYMVTRMPKFTGPLIDQLPDLLDEVDSVAGDLVAPEFSAAGVKDGLKLVGTKGLGCINCHDLGTNKSLGISMVNLTSVHDRVRPGWLNRFLKNPNSINVGTRMPAFWRNNNVIHSNIGDGSVDGQIESIWHYFSLGSSMPVPDGMNVGNSMVLSPTTEPIVFHTFMTDVSPRTIAIGFPESVHLAFDANVVRMAKAWRGAFFDAKGTWDARAGKFLPPLGEQIIDMPPGPAFAVLDNIDSPWPQASLTDRNIGGRFRGYQLDSEKRPILKYQLGDINIQEQPIPMLLVGGANFIRRFTLSSDSKQSNLYLLLGQGNMIKEITPHSWLVDNNIKVSLPEQIKYKTVLRNVGKVKQLLLPLNMAANQSISLDVEISW